MKKTLFAILFAALIVASCEQRIIFRETKQVDPNAWTYADTINFDFQVSDTVFRYNLLLDVVYRDTFSFQNVYTNITTRFPDGARRSALVSFDLFDKRGEPLGHCTGSSCTMTAILQQKALFNQPGSYQISIAQHMRQDSLKGISALQFTLEKHTQK
jgi:gliding motility-associated lipoprotein GldH